MNKKSFFLYLFGATFLCLLLYFSGKNFSTAPKKIEKSEPLKVEDVTHTIKTTKKFHQSRMEVILKTWFQLAANQTYIITDEVDIPLSIKSNYHVVVAKSCGNKHTARDLTCKIGIEFDTFLDHPSKWWCHWDDDNYVNIDKLLKFLSNYDWRKPWYIGRASLNHKLKINYKGRYVDIWFATGGCGICFSEALVKMMKPYVYNNKLMLLFQRRPAHDDVIFGLLINHILKVDLTQSKLFNSHIHHKDIKSFNTPSKLKEQISLSYSPSVHIFLDDKFFGFTKNEDPTRFYSLHCLLYPTTNYCEKSPKT